MPRLQVEHNMAVLRDTPLPLPLKYVAVAWMACTWKWWYYAPNTYKQLKVRSFATQAMGNAWLLAQVQRAV
jgi:hypothetical protein